MVPSPPVPALVSLPPGLPPHELLLRHASVSRRGRAHTELTSGKELTLLGLPNEETWLPDHLLCQPCPCGQVLACEVAALIPAVSLCKQQSHLPAVSCLCVLASSLPG